MNTEIRPKYRLQLGNTYFNKGYFNLGVSVERHLTYDERAFAIFVGDQRKLIDGRISRNANSNGTPRIYGGAELRDWFQSNFRKGQYAEVVILSPTEVWIH